MTKKNNSLLLALAIPLVGICLAAGIIIARNTGKFGELQTFNLDSYLQNWATLQGNEYVIRCQIEQQLGYQEGKGQVLSVKLLDGAGRVPVLVPTALRQNFETGQQYQFKVVVRKDVLYVENAEKV